MNDNNELKELFNPNQILDENKSKIYQKFEAWLQANGAVFGKLSFPRVLRDGYFGCVAKEKIEKFSAILMIPYKIIIDSKKLIQYKDVSQNSLKLTLFLIDEYQKGKQSFFSAYLELILSYDYSSFPFFWSDEILQKVHDKNFVESIKEATNELKTSYENLSTKKVSYQLFLVFYSFVISRQFYVSDNSSFLVPLADLLNHHPNIDVKYEIFDSENYVFKLTRELDEENTDKNLFPTDYQEYFSVVKEGGIRENDKSKLEPINFESEDKDEDEMEIVLEDKDYFVISTNNSSFEKGEEVYNNYGKNSNEYLLMNYGFCLIDNQYDFTKITVTIPVKEEERELKEKIKKQLENNVTEVSDDSITVGFKIKPKKLCKKLLLLVEIIYGDKTAKEKFEDLIDGIMLQFNYEIEEEAEKIKSKEVSNAEKQIAIFNMTQKENLVRQKQLLKNS